MDEWLGEDGVRGFHSDSKVRDTELRNLRSILQKAKWECGRPRESASEKTALTTVSLSVKEIKITRGGKLSDYLCILNEIWQLQMLLCISWTISIH